MKKGKLLLHGSIKIFCGFILLGLLLFGTAGTYYYWNAWIFLLTLAILMISMGGFLYRKNPSLLEKRLNLKFQVQVSHLLKFIGYLVFVGYLAAKDSSDSSFNKHSRGVA